jgi:branched-chain amino acid transport system ATP-binding protein
MTAPLLSVKDVCASYGVSRVLFGVSFDISPGEFVTLLGRNGMGRTTTVNTLMGLHRVEGGSIQFQGRDVTAWRPHQIARLGVGLVPEGRHIFGNLTVKENLLAVSRSGKDNRWNIDAVYRLFPRLAERADNMGSNLSGGEQQMLAIGRALMTNPSLLILDEATEGLAPKVRGEIWRCLNELKKTGLSILVIDKNISPLLVLADRHHIIEKGLIVWSGRSDELRANPALIESYVGVQ